MNTITQITGPGPVGLPPLVNNVKDWDALLLYKTASMQPASLAARVALAKDVSIHMPQGTAQPWTLATPAEQTAALTQFNAVVDALARFSMTSGAVKNRTKDIVVNELFAFDVPQKGFFVRFSVGAQALQIPVYAR